MADAEQAKPIEDVREISAITYGFMASAVFASARAETYPVGQNKARLADERTGERSQTSATSSLHRIPKGVCSMMS